jgi:peptide chain release factor 1
VFDKLQEIEARYQQLQKELSDPKVIADQSQFQKIAKAHAELEPIVASFEKYKKVVDGIQEAEKIIDSEKDDELIALAKEEVAELKLKKEELEIQLKMLLIPKDPADAKNTIVEIRAGAGGEEAGLFATDLFRMYSRYAESKGWRCELLSAHTTGLRGFKEVIFSVDGNGAYSRLKYESGVHRVQRVPVTEASGRIHTSTVTVAVLPEAEEMEVEINPDDIEIDVFRASGPGGQNVNKVESAVRIVHISSGIVVQCQDERSQHKNKAKALKILRARLLARYQEQQHAQRAEARRSQVGTGERSEKIRTYNFPQNRITDHRINLSLHKLDAVLDGELEPLIEALITADQTEKLKEL